MVPGTSPTVSSGLSIFLSKITSGGIAYPPALQQDKTVIWVRSLLESEDGCFSPFLDTTLGGFGLSGKPDSSKFIQLRVCDKLHLHYVIISIG